MQYRILFSLWIFCFSCTASHDVQDKKEVRALMMQLNKHILQENYAAVYDMSLPGSFSTATKAAVLNDLSSSLYEEGYRIKVLDMVIDSIGNVYEHYGDKYARVEHSVQTRIHLTWLPGEDSLHFFARFAQACKDARQAFGASYLQCNEKEMAFYIIQQNHSFAIFDKTYKKWYVLSASSAEKLPNAIPPEIKEKVNYP